MDAVLIYTLPILGAIGGLTALITFIFSRRQRVADATKTETEIDQLVAGIFKDALQAQSVVNAGLKDRLNVVTARMTSLECQVDKLKEERDIKEADMAALKEKLAEYEKENQRYRKENEALRKRINELENQLEIIRQELKDRGCE